MNGEVVTREVRSIERTKASQSITNKKIRKTAALEKKLLKVIKREFSKNYRADAVNDALALLLKRLQFN
jgi:hypothetical protein